MENFGMGDLIILPLMMFAVLVAAVAIVVTIVSFFSRRLQRSSTAASESLQQELRALREEVRTFAVAAPPVAPQPAAPVTHRKISEDQLMILGAVLACHFGKRVKIRSARVISVGSGSNVWSQQGRAAVQASHSSLY